MTSSNRPTEEVPRKRKQTESRKQMKKRARLAMAMFHTAPTPESKTPAPAVPLTEVFEQAGESSGQRKIQLRLPSAVVDTAHSLAVEARAEESRAPPSVTPAGMS